MSFISDLHDIQVKRNTSILQSDFIFEEILKRSGYKTASRIVQYNHLYEILQARDMVSKDIKDAGLSEDVSIIGAITEKICEIGIESVCDRDRFGRLPKNWKWLGDFAITGLPFNLYISVKSYYARERLIVSGTGQIAAPVIGYGLFKDISEWGPSRIQQYKHRGFIAIYMPKELYKELSIKRGSGHPVTEINNNYGKPFLRDLSNFAKDLKSVISKDNVILDLEKF